MSGPRLAAATVGVLAAALAVVGVAFTAVAVFAAVDIRREERSR